MTEKNICNKQCGEGSMLEAYVAVDLEMTGLAAKTDKILEIGAVKVIDHQVTDTFQTFVNPHRILSDTVVELTGITQEMVAEAPEDVEAVRQLIAFTGELPLVGHNIMFDYSFLKQCAANHRIVYEKSAIDTLKISRKCFPELESKKLEAMCRHYQIAKVQEHRALADAMMTVRLLECLWQEFGQGEPELFLPKSLQYRAKRQGPATPAQKRDLIELLTYHKIKADIEVEHLTKSEASRMIDRILFTHGRPTSHGNGSV